MHTFGFPVKLNEINQICSRFNINLIEDAAESLGSFYNNEHICSIGKISAMSFNGNKIITTGGGGMVITNDKNLAIKAKHISTTAKIPNTLAFEHDQIGYNYRLPNLNAALGVAQMEFLPSYLESKRLIAKKYQEWGRSNDLVFFEEPVNTCSNYWLNVAITENKKSRDSFLKITNNSNVMTRPVWTPMHKLLMYKHCQRTNMKTTEWLYSRAVNVPSSPILTN
jgi:dTDP-4-amino-4,6-dideoxygalactose transaminase